MNMKTFTHYTMEYMYTIEDPENERLGKLLAKGFIVNGVPIEISFDNFIKPRFSKEEQIAIYWHCLSEITTHKINSGITDKRLQDHQETSRNQFVYFVENNDFKS
jgi:hypothetical protein